MKYLIVFIASLVFTTSCTSPKPSEQIALLEGYWEITSVRLADGEEKKFSINTLIDYIEVKNDTGIRAKVAPKLDGTFSAARTQEQFVIKLEQDSIRLYYHTPYASWKETVLSLKDSTLVVLNKAQNIYTYKRFRKLNLPQ